MSALSITCLFPFRRAKILDSVVLEDPELGTVIFNRFEPDMRYNPICSVCGAEADNIHSWQSRNLVDLRLGPADNQVELNYRKVFCPECNKYRVEELGVTDSGGPRVTNRMARYIHELCELMTVSEVAEHLNLDWKTVKNVDKAFLEEKYGATDYSKLEYLAFDEISIGKHHRYMTVVLDFITGRVVWMGKGRKVETLDKFFSEMPTENRNNIRAVAMDMWQSYITAVEKWCPQADIVFDKFHIISDFNDVIDQVRRTEQRDKSLSKEEKDVIKGSRYMLLKNEDNLKEKEVPKLEELLELNENLNKVYVLKDALKQVWDADTYEEMATALEHWNTMALETELKPVKRFVGRVITHWYGILNYAKHKIHTSMLEGVNNKIKAIKREAFGFLDQRYFILKVKQAFPGTTS